MAKKLNNNLQENPYANAMVGEVDLPGVSTAEQRAAQLRQQIANRPAFSYDPSTDPLWGAVKDQYMHAGKRAMEDTMGQAAGLTGGYGSTYAQSTGQQSYEEYLTKLNAELPAYFDRARAAYDQDTADLMNLYNLENAQAQIDYNRSRDELADQRYADELAYARQRDALTDQRYADEQKYARDRDALADQRYADELQYSRDQSAQSRAYEMAMQMLATGQMPGASLLSTAGIDNDYARTMSGYYARMLALQNSGGSSGGYKDTGATTRQTPSVTQYTDQEINDAYEKTKHAILMSGQTGNINYAVNALDQYSKMLTPEMAAELMDMLDRIRKNIANPNPYPNGNQNSVIKNRAAGGAKWTRQTK